MIHVMIDFLYGAEGRTGVLRFSVVGVLILSCKWTRSIFWRGTLSGAWVMGCNVFVPSFQITPNVPLYSM